MCSYLTNYLIQNIRSYISSPCICSFPVFLSKRYRNTILLQYLLYPGVVYILNPDFIIPRGGMCSTHTSFAQNQLPEITKKHQKYFVNHFVNIHTTTNFFHFSNLKKFTPLPFHSSKTLTIITYS